MNIEQAEAYLHDLQARQDLAEIEFVNLITENGLPQHLVHALQDAHLKAGNLSGDQLIAGLYLDYLRLPRDEFEDYLERCVRTSI